MTSSPEEARANRLPASKCLVANESSVSSDNIVILGMNGSFRGRVVIYCYIS